MYGKGKVKALWSTSDTKYQLRITNDEMIPIVALV